MAEADPERPPQPTPLCAVDRFAFVLFALIALLTLATCSAVWVVSTVALLEGDTFDLDRGDAPPTTPSGSR